MKAKLKLLLAQFNALKAYIVGRSTPKLVGLKPELQQKAERLIEEMFNLGHAVMVHQGYRSFEEQDYLYAQGRTRPGPIVTNARGGQSNHNFGNAVDIVFIKNGKPSWSNEHPWMLLGTTGERLGLKWGGRWTGFVDRPHFEL